MVQEEIVKGINPIIWADMPDMDVIRVKDVYYMVSTTMHMMPGGVILRSYDLIHWEIVNYIYETLENNAASNLEGKNNIYGKGMWAASLRYYKQTFYVCFVANDTGKTYLFQTKEIEGKWQKSFIEGFYHDGSLLFDEEKVFIIYGNKNIYLTELKEDLSGPKENGIHKKIITDTEQVLLGYEGAHFYKIKNKYYVFLIHWLSSGNKRRVQACFVADEITGEYKGKDVLDDDLDYYNSGIAQGGIVDTPDGEWYAMLFQDHGAVGRIPVLVPISWENDFPVFGIEGKVPKQLTVKTNKVGYSYSPIIDSDSFLYEKEVDLKKVWQWNHNPKPEMWSVTDRKGYLRIKTGKLSDSILEAQNILTQRTMGPWCEGTVYVDGSHLNNGDFAGIAAFQGCFGFIGLTKEEDQYYLVMRGKERREKDLEEIEYARLKINTAYIRLKAKFNFKDNVDEVEFFYQDEDKWYQLGRAHKLYFTLDHFMGCRIALFLYSTKEIGGYVDYKDFEYNVLMNNNEVCNR